MNESQRERFGVSEYAAFKVRPYCNELYNKYMNGIDVIDQLFSSYDRHQRSTSWKTIYIHTSIKMAEAAAYKLYKLYCELYFLVPVDHCVYKQEIALKLLKLNTISDTNAGTTAITQLIDEDDIHFQKVEPKKLNCRYHKCRNNSRFSCGGYKKDGKPLYLCLAHLAMHQAAERERARYI